MTLASPETKAATPEMQAAHDDMLGTFAAYRDANDERLAALERRAPPTCWSRRRWRASTPRIDAPAGGARRAGAEGAPPAARPRRAARRRRRAPRAQGGVRRLCALRRNRRPARLETKAMSVGSNPDGGYLVPVELEREIGRGSPRSRRSAPSPACARSRRHVYKKPFMTAGSAAGWVGETDARTQTDSPTLDELSFPAMELYAMPAATPTLLDDSAVNIDEWIAAEVETGVRRAGGHGLRHRRRHQQAEGLPRLHDGGQRVVELGQSRLSSPPAPPAPSRRPNPSDVLVDLIYALKAGYRQNATFVMNRKTQSAIRKFKDCAGQLSVAAAGHGGRPRLADDASRWSRPRTCRTSPRTRCRSRSAISAAAI